VTVQRSCQSVREYGELTFPANQLGAHQGDAPSAQTDPDLH